MMKHEQPLVYILIVNWHSGKDTIACINSLRGVYYAAYRIVVLDNASTDGSTDMIASAHPDVVLRRLPRNLGFTGANNAGFTYALAGGADFVYVLNADTSVAPDFLSEAVRVATADPSIGIVGSKVFHANSPHTLQFAGARVNLTVGHSGRALGYGELDRGQYDAISDVDRVPGCGMMVSRACLHATGGFDDAFFAFQEDVDLCLRARAAGFRVVMSPTSKVWHKGGGSLGGAASASHMYYNVRNGLRLVDKHQPTSHRGLRWLRSGCIVGAHVGQVILHGLSLPAVRGITAGTWDYYRGIIGERPGTHRRAG